MSISTTTPYVTAAGNGATTVFPYTFKINTTADLVVTLVNDTTQVETAQALTTDYTVSGAGNIGGGNVTMLVAPATGYTLMIRQGAAITQLTDIKNQNPYSPVSVENALDKLTMVAQELKFLIDKCIKAPETEVPAAAVVTLPGSLQRISGYLGWDSSGNLTVLAGTGSGAYFGVEGGDTVYLAPKGTYRRLRVYGAAGVAHYVDLLHTGSAALLQTDGDTLNFAAGLAAQWKLPSSGHWTPSNANTYDLGDSTNTVRSIYWGTQALAPSGAVGAPSYSFASSTGVGMYFSAGPFINFATAGVNELSISTGTVRLRASQSLNWTSSENAAATIDLSLLRDGANDILALKRGTNVQTFRIYGTTTGPKYASLSHDGTNAVYTTNSGDVVLGTSGSGAFVTAAVHVRPGSDSSLDLGTSSVRWRSLYWSSQLLAPNGSAASPNYSFANSTNWGFFWNAASTRIDVAASASTVAGLDGAGFWTVTGGLGVGTVGAANILIQSDGAGITAIKNSTNAQTLRVYGTTTGTKYASIAHDGTNGVISVSSGSLSIGPATDTDLLLTRNGSNAWGVVSGATAWIPLGGGNAKDLGDATNNVRTGYFGTSVVVGTSGWTASATAATGLTAQGNARFAHGTSALATSATEGFLHLQSCAGVPTGTPASIPTAQKPLVIDSNADQLNFYSTSWKALPRTLSVISTAVGNVGGGTDDLMTFTIPANVLVTTNKAIRVKAWGTTANNANAKTLTFNVGSQTVLTTALTVSIAGQWEVEAVIIRTGSSTQDIVARTLQGATLIFDQELTAGTQTETATIVVKCTAAATADNDIVQEGMIVEVIN